MSGSSPKPTPNPSPAPGGAPGNTYAAIEQVDPALAQQLGALERDLSKAGAANAAARLRRAGQSFSGLHPDMVVSWLDPARTMIELEDARGKAARRNSLLRNVVALLPLMLTWLALFWAAGQYQLIVSQALKEKNLTVVNTPFLVLWEEAFNSASWWNHLATFSHVALADCFLLAIIVILTVRSQALDDRTRRYAIRLAGRVDDVAIPLVEAAQRGRIPANANAQDWARVVQDTVKFAMDEVKTLMYTSQQVVRDVGDHTAGVIKSEFKPLVAQFNTDVTQLGGTLGQFQQHVAGIGGALQQLNAAAGQVATATTALASTAGQYQQTADEIKQGIHGLAASNQQVVTTTGKFVQSLDDSARANINTARLVADSAAKLQGTENALNLTGQELQTASTNLRHASQRLARAAVQSAQGGGRRGFFAWLFG